MGAPLAASVHVVPATLTLMTLALSAMGGGLPATVSYETELSSAVSPSTAKAAKALLAGLMNLLRLTLMFLWVWPTVRSGYAGVQAET